MAQSGQAAPWGWSSWSDGCNASCRVDNFEPVPDDESENETKVRKHTMDFTLMTYNVEEYYHGFDRGMVAGVAIALQEKKIGKTEVRDWFARLRKHVFRNIDLIRKLIEKHNPDIICLQEHSLGFTPELLQKLGLLAHLEEEDSFSHGDIVAKLLPEEYSFFVMGTKECPAKFSELANAVAWKKTKFALTSQLGTLITPKGKRTDGGESLYTSRSAALVQLTPIGDEDAVSFVVCSTHLMGGRFEDSNWALDHASGVNERVSQIVAIKEALNSAAFTVGVPVVIAGDFNTMKKGFLEGPFVHEAQNYVFGKTILYARAQLLQDYRDLYVPYQTAVHRKLEALGYSVAYGTEDTVRAMQTSKHSGCVDWIYTKGMLSKKDERILMSNETSGGSAWASDHNAVLVTLSV